VVELCVDLQVPLLQPKWGAAALDAIACGCLGTSKEMLEMGSGSDILKGAYNLMYFMILYVPICIVFIFVWYYDDVF
jgi:hypothetical protein